MLHEPIHQQLARLGLRGAANYMAGRLKAADDDLSRGPLRGDGSASLWRAMVAVERGEWERALEFFRAGEKQINAYSSARAAHFAAAFRKRHQMTPSAFRESASSPLGGSAPPVTRRAPSATPSSM